MLFNTMTDSIDRWRSCCRTPSQISCPVDVEELRQAVAGLARSTRRGVEAVGRRGAHVAHIFFGLGIGVLAYFMTCSRMNPSDRSKGQRERVVRVGGSVPTRPCSLKRASRPSHF